MILSFSNSSQSLIRKIALSGIQTWVSAGWLFLKIVKLICLPLGHHGRLTNSIYFCMPACLPACLPAYIFTAVQKGPLLSPGALLQQVWLCHPGLANIKLSSIFYTKRQPAPSARACPGRFQKYWLKQVLLKKSLVQKLKILHWEFQTNIESPA